MSKKCLFLISFILLSFPILAFCTHYFDYFVYFEDEYLQGGSVCVKDFIGAECEFLIPRKYNELFGTIDLSVYSAILKHLKEEKPELYKGTILLTKYNEEENWETLHVKTNVKSQADFSTIMNEIVCSFSDYSKNKYTVFTFTNPQLQKEYGGKTFSKKDITVPVFYLTANIVEEEELVFPEVPQEEQPVETLFIEVPQKEEKLENKKLKLFLKFSIGLNILLVIGLFLIFLKRAFK